MSISADNLITKCQRNIPDLGQRVEPEDWYFYFTEAIREARAGRTLPWQKRTTTLELFSDIFEYSLPSDFESFIKPHKDMLEKTDEGPFLLYGRDKDFFANNKYELGIKWERNSKTLLAKYDSIKTLTLESFEDAATEYTLAGDASNAVSDDTKYKQGAASLRFDITASTNQSTITRTLDNTIDLTDYINKGYLLLWVDMPTAITSVTIRYGNSASVYYQTATATTDFNGDAFASGKWNLIKFNMQSVTETGTVDDTAIDYYQIIIDNTSVTDTDFRIDSLTFHIPALLELPYNSKNVVTDSTGATYKETITNGSDIILGDECFESAFMYDAIENAALFKLRDNDLAVIARSKKDDRYMNLNRRYPSQEAPVQSNYYKKFRDI